MKSLAETIKAVASIMQLAVLLAVIYGGWWVYSSVTSVKNRIYEEFAGDYSIGTSMSEHIAELIFPRLFMNGLRCGWVESGFMCDGWVVKNGLPFSSQCNAMLVAFSQK